MKYAKKWFVKYDYALASKENPRYSVYDSDTLKVVDDANGYGYKTKENALKSYGYRHRRCVFYLKSFGPYRMEKWKEKFTYAMYIFAEALEDLGINTRDLRISFSDYDRTGRFFIPEEQTDPSKFPKYARLIFQGRSDYRIMAIKTNFYEHWNLQKMMRPDYAAKYASWLVNGTDGVVDREDKK